MALSDYALVDLDTTKTYLKIDDDDSDSTIELLIEAATRKTEDYCSTHWIKRAITETHIGDGKSYLYLYRLPVEEIESVEIDGEDYEDFTERLTIGMLYGSWTNLSEIVVKYTAGHGEDASDDNIPYEAKVAVLMCIADWFNNPTGLDSQNISGIGSISFGEDLELPERVKAKLTNIRKRVI